MKSLDTNILFYATKFDLILATTLVANGVTELYTRNTADFADIDGLSAVNPIDES